MGSRKQFGKTILFALVALAGSSAASPGKTYVFGNVSGWTVLTDSANGYRCFGEVEYEGGTLLRVGYNSPSGQLYVFASDPSWSALATTSQPPAKLVFDDQRALDATATVEPVTTDGAGRGILVSLPGELQNAFLEAFMQRNTLSIAVADHHPLELSLAGSYRTMQMLDECQSSMPGSGEESR